MMQKHLRNVRLHSEQEPGRARSRRQGDRRTPRRHRTTWAGVEVAHASASAVSGAGDRVADAGKEPAPGSPAREDRLARRRRTERRLDSVDRIGCLRRAGSTSTGVVAALLIAGGGAGRWRKPPRPCRPKRARRPRGRPDSEAEEAISPRSRTGPTRTGHRPTFSDAQDVRSGVGDARPSQGSGERRTVGVSRTPAPGNGRRKSGHGEAPTTARVEREERLDPEATASAEAPDPEASRRQRSGRGKVGGKSAKMIRTSGPPARKRQAGGAPLRRSFVVYGPAASRQWQQTASDGRPQTALKALLQRPPRQPPRSRSAGEGRDRVAGPSKDPS